MSGPPTLRTARLVLRPFRPGDGPEVERLAGAFEVADTTINIPHPYPPGGGGEWIATHEPTWESGSGVTVAITIPAPATSADTLVGGVGLRVERKHLCAELGYWIGVPHWGRGYATEAARALLGFGFAGLGLHRIQARHLVRNPASGRVMQKIGMRLEGVLRESFYKWDRFEDAALYAALAPEWTAGSAEQATSDAHHRNDEGVAT